MYSSSTPASRIGPGDVYVGTSLSENLRKLRGQASPSPASGASFAPS